MSSLAFVARISSPDFTLLFALWPQSRILIWPVESSATISRQVQPLSFLALALSCMTVPCTAYSCVFDGEALNIWQMSVVGISYTFSIIASIAAGISGGFVLITSLLCNIDIVLLSAFLQILIIRPLPAFKKSNFSWIL
jgi:hypothetical protein